MTADGIRHHGGRSLANLKATTTITSVPARPRVVMKPDPFDSPGWQASNNLLLGGLLHPQHRHPAPGRGSRHRADSHGDARFGGRGGGEASEGQLHHRPDPPDCQPAGQLSPCEARPGRLVGAPSKALEAASSRAHSLALAPPANNTDTTLPSSAASDRRRPPPVPTSSRVTDERASLGPSRTRRVLRGFKTGLVQQ